MMGKLTKQQKKNIKEAIQDYVTELRELGYTYKQIRKFNRQLLIELEEKCLTYLSHEKMMRDIKIDNINV